MYTILVYRVINDLLHAPQSLLGASNVHVCTMYIVARHRDLGVEERLDDLYGKVRELEKQNTILKSKVRD